MFARIRSWYRRRQYRPGRVMSRFLARDVRRDVEVVDASRIDAGVLTVRMRTWNVLYAAKGLSPQPPFGEVRDVAVAVTECGADPTGDAVGCETYERCP